MHSNIQVEVLVYDLVVAQVVSRWQGVVQGRTPCEMHSEALLKKLEGWRMAGQGLGQSKTPVSISSPWASGSSLANGMTTSAMLKYRLLRNWPQGLLDTTSTRASG